MKKFQLLYLLMLMMAVMMPQTASAEYYGIKVAGVSVTSDNCHNITSEYIKQRTMMYPSYSVDYDPSTKTLTLDNISISRSGSYNRAILNESCDGLTIVIKHCCTLYAADSSPVRLNKNTTIKSTLEDGIYKDFLEILGKTEDALTIGDGATLTIDGAFIYMYASQSNALEGATENEKVIIKNHSVVMFDYWNYYLDSQGIGNLASLDIQGSYVRIETFYNVKSITYSDCVQLNSSGQRNRLYAPYVPIDETTFPDENLREYILSTDYNYNGKGVLVHTPNINEAYRDLFTGFKYDKTIESVTAINVSNKGIANAKGLEMFVNLTSLNVAYNNLTALTVTPFKSLERLYCYTNQLTYLNLTNNRKLTQLYCHDNQLTALKLSNNKELTDLACDQNQLTTLNLSNQTKLTALNCLSNQITSLTLACSDTLAALRCSMNKLTSLNLSGYNKLKTLYCNTNQLTSLTLPKGDALRQVYCSENKLTTLDVSGNTELTDLQCLRNSLTSLNVKNCGKIANLFCQENKLSELDLTDNTAMTWLDCSNNVLTALNVSKNKNLQRINASYNKLETLDLTWNNQTGNGVFIWGNKIKGEGLDNMIANLPAVEGRTLYLVDHEYENEENECTATQVEAAKKKGWTIYHTWGNQIVPTTECKNYDLWFKGRRACNHGTGVGYTPYTYNDETKTLSLNNAVINYDGTIGILSKIDNLNVKLTGKNTINTPGSSLGIRLMKNTEDSKVTFSGSGELNITSGGIALQTYADVEFKDGVKVSAEGSENLCGMQGRKFSADSNYPSITISGLETEVKAKGGTQGSVLNFHALNLNDGITIAEPIGATFVEDYGVVKDNRIVAGEWVIFNSQDYIDGIDNVNANDNLNKGTYNLAGQKVGADYKGIVITGNKKYLKK